MPDPYSYRLYSGNGAQQNFSVPFPYISKSHISVKVGGVAATFTWVNATTVQITPAPASGTNNVEVRRTTPINELLVDFSNGSVQEETDMDTANLQAMYAEQEIADFKVDAIYKRDDGKMDAQDCVIKNVATPVNGTDAANKAYVDAQDDATEAAVAASAAAAATSATNAANSASAAATSATNAATSATNAATSATNAANSATASAGSATSAAASAAAAADTLASALWRDVVFKTFADSPITIASGDKSKLLVIDTAGGNVVVNLPQISGLTLPFTVGIKKNSSDANTVTINRAGTDTIDGNTSKTISAPGGTQLLADTDPNPDRWTSADFGLAGGNMSVYEVTGDGTTATYDTGTNPGTENNTWVFIDGAFQPKTAYSFSGSSITLSENLPNGSKMEVMTGTTLSIGVPSDGSVTAAKLAADAVETAKIKDLNVTTAKIADGAVIYTKTFDPRGHCRVSRVSATQLRLDRHLGKTVPIKTSGVWKSVLIPSSGWTVNNTGVYVDGVASQNLGANANYLLCLFDNAGTPTFDFVTTLTHTQDSDEGVEIKSGDPTRTVIALIGTNGSNQFVDDDEFRFISNWFNQRPLPLFKVATTDATINQGSFGELTNTPKFNFLVWSGAMVHGSYAGAPYLSSANTGYLGCSWDGNTPSAAVHIIGQSGSLQAAAQSVSKSGLSEGRHYMDLSGYTSGGATMTFPGGGGNERGCIAGWVMG